MAVTQIFQQLKNLRGLWANTLFFQVRMFVKFASAHCVALANTLIRTILL